MFIFLQKKKKKERKVVAQHWELLRFFTFRCLNLSFVNHSCI